MAGGARAGGSAHRPAALAGAGAGWARPDPRLGRCRSGGRRPRARRADPRPLRARARMARMRFGSAARARFSSLPPRSLPPTAGATAGARPASTTAGRRSKSLARTRRRRSCRRPRPISAPARPRLPSSSLACAASWPGQKLASGCMSRRHGWRRCSPGSTASSRKPNRVAALDRFQQRPFPNGGDGAMAGSSC